MNGGAEKLYRVIASVIRPLRQRRNQVIVITRIQPKIKKKGQKKYRALSSRGLQPSTSGNAYCPFKAIHSDINAK